MVTIRPHYYSSHSRYYLLINLSIRDILLACLCVPFTLNYEIIAYTWDCGYIFCIVYRFAYYCFLFFLPLTILFLAWHLFVENCKWNFAGETIISNYSHGLINKVCVAL